MRSTKDAEVQREGAPKVGGRMNGVTSKVTVPPALNIDKHIHVRH